MQQGKGPEGPNAPKPKPNKPTDVNEPSNVRPPDEPVPEKKPPVESAD